MIPNPEVLGSVVVSHPARAKRGLPRAAVRFLRLVQGDQMRRARVVLIR